MDVLPDDILGEWLSCFDEILAHQRVDIRHRPLPATALFVEHAITEMPRGESKDNCIEKPWFAAIYKQTERWYHNRYPAIFAQPAETLLLGFVPIFGTPFEVRVPTCIQQERNPDGTFWICIPNSVLPDEEPLTWIIHAPQIGDEVERGETRILVTDIAAKLRSIRVNLPDFSDHDTQALAQQILPYLESGARGLLSNTGETACSAIWQLFFATEITLKVYLRQKGQNPPNIHDLYKLNARSDVGSGPVVPPSALVPLPTAGEANKYRYGEIPPPSVQETFEIYRAVLNIIVRYTGALDRKLIMNNARFLLRSPLWRSPEAQQVPRFQLRE